MLVHVSGLQWQSWAMSPVMAATGQRRTPGRKLPSAKTQQLQCETTGDQFALFEAVVALAMLMRRYEFTIDPAAPEVHTPLETLSTCRSAEVNVTLLDVVIFPDSSPHHGWRLTVGARIAGGHDDRGHDTHQRRPADARQPPARPGEAAATMACSRVSPVAHCWRSPQQTSQQLHAFAPLRLRLLLRLLSCWQRSCGICGDCPSSADPATPVPQSKASSNGAGPAAAASADVAPRQEAQAV